MGTRDFVASEQHKPYVEAAEEYAKLKGLVQAQKPGDMAPDLPPDISEISLDALGKFMTQFMGWKAFAGYEYALAEAEETINKKIYEYYFGQGVLRWEDGNKVDVFKALSEREPQVKQARKEWFASKTKMLLMKSMYDRFTSHYELCSRELSRREMKSRIVPGG
jgi:hypothetical protein